MTVTDILNALGTPPRINFSGAVRDNILIPFCDGQALTFDSNDPVESNDPVVTVTGRARFPQVEKAHLHVLSFRATATIIATDGDPDVTVVFDQFPVGWSFGSSFPDLPTVLNPGKVAPDDHEPLFDHVTGEGANLTSPQFVVKSSGFVRGSHTGTVNIDATNNALSLLVGNRPAISVSLATGVNRPVQSIVDELNNSHGNFKAVASAASLGGAVAIRGSGGLAVTILAGTANPVLGLTAGSIGFAGLSFTSVWTPPSGLFGVLPLGVLPNRFLAGPVVIPPDGDPPPLGTRLPWEIETAPGIHLQSHLGGATLGPANSISLDLSFQAYSPLLNDWLARNPGFDPVTGFSGSLGITDIGQPLTVSALKLPGVDQLLLNARGLGITVPSATGPLVHLAGAGLPQLLRDQLSDRVSLESVSIWLSGSSSSPSIEQITLKLAAGRDVRITGSASSVLGLLPDTVTGRVFGSAAGPFSITPATNILTVAIDGVALPDIPLPVGTDVRTDDLAGALKNNPGFRAVAVAENIAGTLAITSAHSLTPAGWPFHVAIALTDATVTVLSPFEDASRSFAAVLDGTFALTVGSVNLVVDVSLNVGTVIAVHGEQRGAASVPLTSIFGDGFIQGFADPTSLGFTPPAISLTGLQFSATPATKAFDVSFRIDADTPSPNPADAPFSNASNLHFAIRNDGTAGSHTIWELAAESEEGLAIGGLFQRLAHPDLPAPLHDVKLKSFSIGSTEDRGGFKAECAGDIPVDGLDDPLAVTLSFEHTKDGAAKDDKFSAGVVVAGLEFDLILDRAVNPDAESDPAKAAAPRPALQLDDLLSKLLPASDRIGLPPVQISLNDILFFYRSERTGANVEKGALAVLDVGAGVDISSISGLGPLSAILDLLHVDLSMSLRLLAATGTGFTPDQVGEMNGLLPDTIEKLPAEIRYQDKFAIRRGFDHVLRLGNESIGADSSGDGANGAASPMGATSTAPRADAVKWFSIQRSLGPVHFKRIGVAFKPAPAGTTAPPRALFAIDAGASLSGLALNLQGFSVSVPLALPPPAGALPELGLSGISLSYQTGALEIAGAFLKDPLNEKRFLGAAVLRTTSLSLTAFGAFGLSPTNLFVFAVLDYPLGGPSFFFITGLAAGFGYNIDLTLPSIAGVKTFPFVTALETPGPPPDLVSLSAITPARAGAYWVAVGIKFTSFQLVQSTALLFVKFGQDLEFLLLGTSQMSLPKNVPGQPVRSPYLNIELAFRVSVKPNAGEFAAEALLTDSSFVIHPSCRLTGGFAFYAWFGNSPHAGDFVLTVGGYHPRFTVPAHYPQVPRLGINWPVSPTVSIKGEAYFALTPSCVMAGGSLEASYQDGTLEASFTARANFLIRWEPFFYDIDVFISLRAALVIDTLFGTLRLGTELSAGVHIWGPEFAGTAHVTWTVISFDVAFGAKDTRPGGAEILNWERFSKAFLPPVAEAKKGWTAREMPSDSTQREAPPALQICQANIESGLAREVEVFDAVSLSSRKHWVVLPNTLQLSTQTAIPSGAVSFQGARIVDASNGAGQPLFGFGPMGGGPVTTAHAIRIVGTDGGPSPATSWQFDPGGRLQKMPKALWDTQPSTPSPSAELLPDPLVVGLTGIRPVEPRINHSSPIPVGAFDFTVIDVTRLALSRGALAAPSGAIATGLAADNRSDIGITVAEHRARRGGIINLAHANGFPSLNADPLTQPDPLARLSTQGNTIFLSPPMLGPLGSGGVAQVSVPAAPGLPEPAVDEGAIATIVSYLLSVLQYSYVGAAGVSGSTTGATTTKLDSRVVITPVAAPQTPATATTTAGSAAQDFIAGQSVVLSIEHTRRSRPQRPALAFSDGLSFQVRTFDSFGQLVQENTVSGSGKLMLASSAARVVVSALPPVPANATPSSQTTFGWTGASTLLQAGPRLFFGDGASVQTDASYETSSIRGADMVRQNQLQVPGTAGRQLVSGSFRTLLPAGIQTLAVLVRRSGALAEPGLGTNINVTRADGVTLNLLPLHVLSDAPGQFALIYRVPANLEQVDQRVAVVARATGGSGAQWEIQGVTGILEKPEKVRFNWENFRLRAPLTVVQTAATGKARMTVVAA